MGNPFRVYQASIGDLAGLAELFDRYRVYYRQASDIEGARKFLFDRFEHQESVILYVQDEAAGRMAGFTQLYPLFSSVSMQRLLLLNDLYVADDYRRQGLGQMLLDAAKNYAVQIRAKGIELSTSVTNVPAQSLYERNGYVRDSEYNHYFWGVQSNNE